jgi:hypothetical protein
MTGLFWSSYGLLWLLVIVQGLAFLEVLRQVGMLRTQVGPMQGAGIMTGAVPTGSPLPPAAGFSSDSRSAVAWDDLITTRRGVAVFLTPTCVTCREIAQDIRGFSRDVPGDVSVAVFVKGTSDEVEALIRETEMPRELVVVDREGGTANSLGIGWTPAALTIQQGLVGAAAIVNTIYQVDALVQEQFGDDEEGESEIAQLATADHRLPVA